LPADLSPVEREILGFDSIPEEEVEREVDADLGRVRQVGIKLSPRDFRKLADAADRHGVRPTTMARLLLKRALGALERGEERTQPDRGARP